MKAVNWILLGGLIAFVACQDTGSDNKIANNDSTRNAETEHATRGVPANVPPGALSTFEEKYPKASNVRWNRYEPINKSLLAADDWRRTLDSNDYQVIFDLDGTEYYAWFDDGTWIRDKTTLLDNSKLPTAVSDVIKKEFEGYTIIEVDRENYKNAITFEVDLKKGEEKIKVQFDEMGKVLTKRAIVDSIDVRERLKYKDSTKKGE